MVAFESFHWRKVDPRLLPYDVERVLEGHTVYEVAGPMPGECAKFPYL